MTARWWQEQLASYVAAGVIGGLAALVFALSFAADAGDRGGYMAAVAAMVIPAAGLALEARRLRADERTTRRQLCRTVDLVLHDYMDAASEVAKRRRFFRDLTSQGLPAADDHVQVATARLKVATNNLASDRVQLLNALVVAEDGTTGHQREALSGLHMEVAATNDEDHLEPAPAAVNRFIEVLRSLGAVPC